MNALPSTKRYHAAWHRHARFVAQRILLRPLVHLTTRVTVRGAKNLDGLGAPFIVVANHSSHLDAPLLVTELPRRYTRELAINAAADYFYRWWWIKATTSLFFNTYPVNRTNTEMGKGRGLANRLLSEDIPVVVFPEGTRRNTEGGVKRFKPGAAALSIAQGVPCVPVAIVGTDQAMPVGHFWPKAGRPPVMLIIGAPIHPQDGERTRELTERLEAKVAAMVSTGDPDAEGPPLCPAQPDEPTEQASDHAQKKGGVVTGVKHQKWWGWGVEGVAFTHEDKPRMAPFVMERVSLDLGAPRTPPPAFEDLKVPASQLPDALAATLSEAVGEQYVDTDDLTRVVHTYGKGLVDLVRVRAGDLPRVPDVVVYPADEDQVRQIVDAVVAADAVLIPFGGGSNISGSLTPQPGEQRVVVSLDLGRLNRVLEIDEAAGLARVQAGVLGPDLEEQLGARGWTTGHQPDSFKHSTLGGWIATRSSGMQSDKYGDIADIARGMRVVLPGKVVVLRPLPSTSSGPSVREMILGSEGRLGVITEAWVHVHRVPENREVIAYLFPTWAAGIAAMHDISESDVSPTVTRVSDANETAFSLAMRKPSKGLTAKVGPILFNVLERRGWDLSAACLSYIGYEGSESHLKYEKSLVGKIVKKHGGIKLGKGPGSLYDQKKFDTPYIRDFLLDIGALSDVSETAAPWSKLMNVYTNTIRVANDAYDELGVEGFVMCHLSHSYHSGACLYFTFAFPPGSDVPAEQIDQYWVVKKAIQQSFIDNEGTISHHHGVGTDHAHWLEDDISPAGTDVMVGLLKSVDPGRNLNPGTLLPAHREW